VWGGGGGGGGGGDGHIHLDLSDFEKAKMELDKYPKPDFIFASPPCESWVLLSYLQLRKAFKIKEALNIHWKDKWTPLDLKDKFSATRENGVKTSLVVAKIIKEYKPRFWVIENGASSLIFDYMEEFGELKGFRNKTNYGAYGFSVKKPTIMFSNCYLELKHSSRYVVTTKNINNMNSYAEKSKVPPDLYKDILHQFERMPFFFCSMNISEILNELKIPFWDEGKNVKQGWHNICCPFCDDKSNHGGISPNGFYKCWRCEGGTLLDALLLITKFPKFELVKILKKYNYVTPSIETAKSTQHSLQSIPGGKLSPMHHDYLLGRDYDSFAMEKKYGLKGTGLAGNWQGRDFSYRLIMPVKDIDGNLISFLGRDITGKQELRYKNCPAKLSAKPVKETLYNIEIAKGFETVIVCEGVFDLWRIDIPQSVATFGIELSQTQINLLSMFKKIIFIFDPEEKAQKNAKAYAKRLSGAGCDAYVLDLRNAGFEKDLADMNHAELQTVLAETKDFFI
jgi:5S rRNA maturation endonuclease (ribonuclease M5)